MRPRRTLSLTILSLLLVVPPAFAAGPIAVLAPQLKPAGPAELRDRYHDSIVKGMSKSGDVIPSDEVRKRLAATPELLACTGGPCIARAATLLGAEKVVVVEIEDVGKNYSIKTRIFDATGKDIGTGPEERCEICTVREAGRAVERAGERSGPVVVAAKVTPPAPPPETKPARNPDDEEVPGDQPKVTRATRVEPKPAETKPAETKPAVKPAETKPATKPAETKPAVAVKPAETKPAETKPAETKPAETKPVAATPETPPGADSGKRFPYRPLAIGAFALAGASLAATITFAVFASKENQTTCDPSVSKTACPKIYKGNVAPAAAFGALTAVAAGAGAVLLYLDWKHPAKKRPTVAAGPLPEGGFAAALSLDF